MVNLSYTRMYTLFCLCKLVLVLTCIEHCIIVAFWLYRILALKRKHLFIIFETTVRLIAILWEKLKHF